MTGFEITPNLGWLAIGAGPEPYFLLLAALIIDAAIGVVWRRRGRLFDRLVAQLFSEVVRRLERRERSPATRLVRGGILLLVVLVAAATIGIFLGFLAASVPFGWIAGLLALLLLLDQRTTLATLVHSLRQSSGDETALRQSMESAALRYAEGIVALAFWYGLLGFAGLVTYRAVFVLALLFDRPGADDAGLGFAALRFHEAVGWIPLRLAGVVLALAAAFTPGASAVSGLATMIGHSPGRRLRSAAWPIAAVAGALGVSLAGPRHLDGPDRGVSPWIEPQGARGTVNAADTHRFLYLLVVACVFAAFVILLVAMVELSAPA